MSCRELCAASGEPLAGSAGTGVAFAAIAWPKRRWHPDQAARSEGLPQGLAELEDCSKERGERLLVRVFQRSAPTPTDAVEMLFYRRGGSGFRAPEVPRERLVDVLEAALHGEGAGLASEPLGPELLVCTDGQHDDCCARFGRPVYRALCDALERRAPELRVSESSHLGGHRFAANLLHLPRGDLYGRLEPRDVPLLLRAFGAGKLLRYRYRGRLGSSEAAQAVDALLAARLPEGAEWEVREAEAGASDELQVPALVHLDGAARELRVCCERRTFQGPASCGAQDETRLRWVAVSIEEA